MQQLRFQPIDPKSWQDLAALFAERGESKSCWCMLGEPLQKKVNAKTVRAGASRFIRELKIEFRSACSVTPSGKNILDPELPEHRYFDLVQQERKEKSCCEGGSHNYGWQRMHLNAANG